MATSGSKTVSIFSWISLKFEWSQTSQSVTNNTTAINWKLSATTTSGGALYKKNRTWTVTIDGTKYTGTVDVSLDKSSTQTLASGTATINHNGDGSKTFAYSFSQQFELTLNSGTYMSTYSGNGTDTLTTIPRKSSISVPDGTLRSSQTITVTQQSSGFTHSIKAVCGGSTLYIKADGTTSTTEVKHNDCSIPWTPPIDWASQAPQGQSVSVTFTIATYNGSTNIGTNTDTATYAIPDDVYSPLAFDISDLAGREEYFGDYIQNQSKLTVDITTYGVYGAWIKSYKVEVDGKAYTEGTVDGTNIIVETDTIKGYGDLPVVVTVTDSRDRTTIGRSTISVLKYEPPKITNLTAYRSNYSGSAVQTGGFITVKFSAEVYSLNNKNSATHKIRWKASNQSTYEEVILGEHNNEYSVIDGMYVIGVGDLSADVVLIVSDRLHTISQNVVGPALAKVWSLLKKGGRIVGAAIGKVAEYENLLDIAWPVRFSGGIDDPNFEYVVEQGEANGWTYRKWNSGVGECWKTLVHNTAISTQWGSIYMSPAIERQSYPFPFINKPVENVTAQGNAPVWVMISSNGNGVNGAYGSAVYHLCSPGSYTASAEFYISYYCIGKWK